MLQILKKVPSLKKLSSSATSLYLLRRSAAIRMGNADAYLRQFKIWIVAPVRTKSMLHWRNRISEGMAMVIGATKSPP